MRHGFEAPRAGKISLTPFAYLEGS